MGQFCSVGQEFIMDFGRDEAVQREEQLLPTRLQASKTSPLLGDPCFQSTQIQQRGLVVSENEEVPQTDDPS